MNVAPMIGLALLLAGSAARADGDAEQPPIHLTLHPCVPVPEEGVRQILAIELKAPLTKGVPAAAGVIRVAIECADAQIWLQVDDSLTGKSMLRRLDLLKIDPAVRVRLLGLAIAELVSASWPELLADREPAIRTAELLVPDLVRLAAAAASTRTPLALKRGPGEWSRPRILSVAMLTSLASEGIFLVGGGLRLGWSHRRRVGFLVDVIAQHGSVETGHGSVVLDTLHTGTALLFDRSWRRLALQLGGGFRFGLARLEGQPLPDYRLSGRALVGAWGAPTLMGGVSLRAHRRVVLEAHLEGGYVITPVLGYVPRSGAVRFEGPYLGAQLGLGFLP